MEQTSAQRGKAKKTATKQQVATAGPSKIQGSTSVSSKRKAVDDEVEVPKRPRIFKGTDLNPVQVSDPQGSQRGF